MPTDLAASPFLLVAIVLEIIGGFSVIAGGAALARKTPLRFALRTFVGLLLMAIGALAGTIGVGVQGYRAITHEEIAASIRVQPLGAQRYAATVRFPDGRETAFELAGDEIYVDAQILKWKPLANVLGLHTAYELDRIAGRYRAIDQERASVRTVYSLRGERTIDLFTLRRRHAFLAPLLDADYGSATFLPVAGAATLELRVSTSGLLLREIKANI